MHTCTHKKKTHKHTSKETNNKFQETNKQHSNKQEGTTTQTQSRKTTNDEKQEQIETAGEQQTEEHTTIDKDSGRTRRESNTGYGSGCVRSWAGGPPPLPAPEELRLSAEELRRPPGGPRRGDGRAEGRRAAGRCAAKRRRAAPSHDASGAFVPARGPERGSFRILAGNA